MQMTKDKVYNNEFYNALSEIDVILEYMEITSIFPENFIKFIKENKNNNHNFIYDTTMSLNNQNITNTTKQILAILYSEYFCDIKQKEKLENIWIENDKNELEKGKISQNQKENTVSNSIIKYKEPLFKKILNKIKILMKLKKK